MDRVPARDQDDREDEAEEEDEGDMAGDDNDHLRDRRAGDALLDGAALRRNACSQASQPPPQHIHGYRSMSGIERKRAEVGNKCTRCQKTIGLAAGWVCVDDCPGRSVLSVGCNGARRDIL